MLFPASKKKREEKPKQWIQKTQINNCSKYKLRNTYLYHTVHSNSTLEKKRCVLEREQQRNWEKYGKGIKVSIEISTGANEISCHCFKARLIVSLTKQVVLKSRAMLITSWWKGAQKHTGVTVDPLLKTKPIPFLLMLLEYYQTVQ